MFPQGHPFINCLSTFGATLLLLTPAYFTLVRLSLHRGFRKKFLTYEHLVPVGFSAHVLLLQHVLQRQKSSCGGSRCLLTSPQQQAKPWPSLSVSPSPPSSELMYLVSFFPRSQSAVEPYTENPTGLLRPPGDIPAVASSSRAYIYRLSKFKLCIGLTYIPVAGLHLHRHVLSTALHSFR